MLHKDIVIDKILNKHICVVMEDYQDVLAFGMFALTNHIAWECLDFVSEPCIDKVEQSKAMFTNLQAICTTPSVVLESDKDGMFVLVNNGGVSNYEQIKCSDLLTPALIKHVQEVNAIEPKEVFKINEVEHFFSSDGLLHVEGLLLLPEVSTLHDLLLGRACIKKRPFKPKKGERYYYVDCGGDIDWYCLNGDLTDIALIEMGNYFETEEQARENKSRFMEIFSKYE